MALDCSASSASNAAKGHDMKNNLEGKNFRMCVAAPTCLFNLIKMESCSTHNSEIRIRGIMKKQLVLISTSLFVVLFAVGITAAQNDKKMTKAGMDMMAMEKSPHHTLMMAHHHSAMAFATVLRDTTMDGKFTDLEVARNAFAEIKHCMDQMDMIHRMHMKGMSKEMMDKMKPMMADMKAKMDAEKAAVNGHIAALEMAFQMETPDAAGIHKHASELIMAFEKKMPPEKKMDMSGKKTM